MFCDLLTEDKFNPIQLVSKSIGYQFLDPPKLRYQVMTIMGKYRDCKENPKTYLGLINVYDNYQNLRFQTFKKRSLNNL